MRLGREYPLDQVECSHGQMCYIQSRYQIARARDTHELPSVSTTLIGRELTIKWFFDTCSACMCRRRLAIRSITYIHTVPLPMEENETHVKLNATLNACSLIKDKQEFVQVVFPSIGALHSKHKILDSKMHCPRSPRPGRASTATASFFVGVYVYFGADYSGVGQSEISST